MAQEAQRAQVLSIVIPVYNERDTWRELVARVEAVALPELGRQIILVEDGSSDGTRRQVQELAEQVSREDPSLPSAGQVRHKVVFHERNQGKGAALRTGFAAADGDIVIVQDADLEYDPNDYPRLLAPILAGAADVVYGARFPRGGGRRGYWTNYIANRLLTALSNLKTGLKLTDMETCYKMFRRDVLRQLVLEQDCFGFEPEVTAKLAQLPVRIAEIPIAYHGRTHAEGKKIGWKDGVQAVRCIFRYGRRRRRAATMEQAE